MLDARRAILSGDDGVCCQHRRVGPTTDRLLIHNTVSCTGLALVVKSPLCPQPGGHGLD